MSSEWPRPKPPGTEGGGDEEPESFETEGESTDHQGDSGGVDGEDPSQAEDIGAELGEDALENVPPYITKAVDSIYRTDFLEPTPTGNFEHDLPLLRPKLMRHVIGWLKQTTVNNRSMVETAEDIVQSALMRAWQHRDKFNSRHSLAGWLYAITRNQYQDYWKKLHNRVEFMEGGSAEDLLAEVPVDKTPEKILIGKQEVERLFAGIAELPPRQKQLMEVLVKKELGEDGGETQETVDSRRSADVAKDQMELHDARAALGELFPSRVSPSVHKKMLENIKDPRYRRITKLIAQRKSRDGYLSKLQSSMEDIEMLVPQQRLVMERLVAVFPDRPMTQIATELGISRQNVYALEKRALATLKRKHEKRINKEFLLSYSDLSKLSPQEQVEINLAAVYSIRKVAKRLGISHFAIGQHIRRSFKKLGLPSPFDHRNKRKGSQIAEEDFSVLGPRERQIIERVTNGVPEREIVEELGISRGTVQTNITNALKKVRKRQNSK